MRLIYNPADKVNLLRIINVPKRGIGAASLQKLEDYAAQEHIGLLEAISSAVAIDGISTRTKNSLEKFSEMFFDLLAKQVELPLDDLIEYVLEHTSYLQALQEEGKVENEKRIANLQELIGVARDFMREKGEQATLEEFLSQTALVSDLDNADLSDDRVTLMTLHTAKGLEYPLIFMVGMEEGLFPHARTLLSDKEMEEERRACYVGITRAKRQLYLTYAKSRTIYGRTNNCKPSRFLAEIPDKYLEYERPRYTVAINSYNKPRHSMPKVKIAPLPVNNTCAVKPDLSINWRPGDKVEHVKWGKGTIVARQGSGEEVQLSIVFSTVGLKKVMQKYAPLKKI